MVGSTPRVLCVSSASGAAGRETAAVLRGADSPFTVETAASAGEGLARLDDSPPDCIVSADTLPDMDALEFLQAAREQVPELPFVLCTDGGGELTPGEALDAGADDCLREEADPELLATRVWNVIQARDGGRETDREAELMRLTEVVGDTGGFELNLETDSVRITRGAGRLTGLSGGGLYSLDEILELHPPDDRSEIRQAIDRTVETGEQTRGVWRYRPADSDEERMMEITFTPTEGGRRLRGAVRDVTDRRERQRELQRLRQAIDGANVAMTLSDPGQENNPLVYVNDAFEEMTGYTEAEVLGRSRKFLKSEHNDPERMETLREAMAKEEPVTVELRTTRKDGTELWTRLTVSPIHDEDGRLVRHLWTQEDITERKERERELREERRFIGQALDALDDLFYVLDEDGTIQRWNERVPEVTGYEESELPGMHALDFFVDDDHGPIADAVGGVLDKDRAAVDAVEAELVTADGERIPYEFTGGRLTDAEGNTTGLVGVGRDVTERRQRERRFRALVENSNDIISIVDAETGRFTYQSPSVEGVLGYTPEETVGDTAWEYIHPDDRERTIAAFETWVNTPDMAPETVEYRARHADGSWRWMEAQGNDQRDTQSVDGFVINSRDVTQRKERQQQLSLLNRVLRHNLRNDLNVVLGEADTIHSRASGTVADSAGQIIQKGEELLQTAEVEREIVELLRKQPESRELAVRPLLGQIVSTVASDHPEAVLDIDCPDGISIRATREFGEAVRELVTNAVEHNDDQSPEVTVTVEQRADTTRIEVADTGPRIPEMERDVLVGRGERTPLYHGTGLGLWFVELVVSRSGGTITFEENSPTGNIVGIELSE